MNCPHCGSPKWKTTQQQLTQEYKKCSGCGYAPLEEAQRPSAATETDFVAWMTGLAKEEQEAGETYALLEAESRDRKLSIVEAANLRKSQRQLERATKRLAAAKALADLIELSDEGQITLHLPELGLLYQFNWGDYDLFKALKRGWRR